MSQLFLNTVEQNHLFILLVQRKIEVFDSLANRNEIYPYLATFYELNVIGEQLRAHYHHFLRRYMVLI